MNNYYINRELSWLKFNKRVLEEAVSKSVPLFERLKFISIFTSNLDEFFMVRVGSLYDRSLLKDEMPDNKTGMTAKEQLDIIYKSVRPLYAIKDEYYSDVTKKLCESGIKHLDFKSLLPAQTKFIKQYFKREILPLVSPQIIDTKHPFPHLENKRLHIFVSLKHNGKSSYGIIPISNVFKRVIYLQNESNKNDEKNTIPYMLVEEIILKYVSEIFKPYNVQSPNIIRITRNADIEVEDNFSDEDIDYRDYVKVIIKKREKLASVRLETNIATHIKNNKLIKHLCERIGLSEQQCYQSIAPLDISYIWQLESKLTEMIAKNSLMDEEKAEKKLLLYSTLVPQNQKDLDYTKAITEQIDKKDIFLSYPYYSMKPYLMLLKEAAEDEETISIKITLYRLSSNSEVISLLCKAAENGKEVTAVVELKARFDETNNINWSKRLEEAGCRIIYGIDTLKVHSKITLFTRRTEDKIKYITHIGTGNYNEKTARLYTDVGVITSDVDICDDAVDFFQNMTLGVTQEKYEYLLVAPNSLKINMIKEIQIEAEKAQAGGDSYICMKMNSLTDKEIIDELVKASQAGVKIDLIIRGICCLQPGVENYTSNIRVISIVGRFLEHSRIFIFGDRKNPRVYIGSADMMTRNTSRRIEIMTPILDKDIACTLYEMTDKMLIDNVKSSVLCSNGEYEHILSENDTFDSQIYFYGKAYENK